MHFAPPQHVSKFLFLFRIQSLIQLDVVIFFQGKNHLPRSLRKSRDVQNTSPMLPHTLRRTNRPQKKYNFGWYLIYIWTLRSPTHFHGVHEDDLPLEPYSIKTSHRVHKKGGLHRVYLHPALEVLDIWNFLRSVQKIMSCKLSKKGIASTTGIFRRDRSISPYSHQARDVQPRRAVSASPICRVRPSLNKAGGAC